MQLTIREVTRLLNVSESAVYRWLDEGEIPACHINDEVRFNRSELLEWATLRKIPISNEIFQEPANGSSLARALELGGVHYGVSAPNPKILIELMVAALPAPQEERQILLEILLARGSEAITPVGNAIAIPHVRHPAVLTVPRPLIAVYFLDEPLDLRAPDGKPVEIFFFLVSPTVRIHLHMLSRLAAALHDDGFRSILSRRGGKDEIFQQILRIEGKSK